MCDLKWEYSGGFRSVNRSLAQGFDRPILWDLLPWQAAPRRLLEASTEWAGRRRRLSCSRYARMSTAMAADINLPRSNRAAGLGAGYCTVRVIVPDSTVVPEVPVTAMV